MRVLGAFRTTSASITFTIAGTLTLESSGTLDNPGVIRAGTFVNNGGTILGNAPVALSGLRIQELNLEPAGTAGAGGAASGQFLTLIWVGPPRQTFLIESSADLRQWNTVPATVTEETPGRYQARLARPLGSARFYRVTQRP